MTTSRSILISLTFGLAACGGDDDGGGGNVDEQVDDAIADIMAQAIESVHSGNQFMDTAIFWDPPALDNPLRTNPAAYPADSSRTLEIGAQPADGTNGLEVTVANMFTPNADGTGTIKTTVVEEATGFTFLDLTAEIQRPTAEYRIPDWGLINLAEDGTGQAYVIFELSTSATVTRTFTNVNPDNDSELIDFSVFEVPSGTATASGDGLVSVVIELNLKREGGELIAKVGDDYSHSLGRVKFLREGGPAYTDHEMVLDSFEVGGVAVEGPDYSVTLGSDFPGRTGAAPDSEVAISVTSTGGVEGAGKFGFFQGRAIEYEPSTFGPFVPFFEDSATMTFPLKDLPGVDDGELQMVQVEFWAFRNENSPMLVHSIGIDDLLLAKLRAPMDLIQSAHLISFSGATNGVAVFR
jgi:hypothetical protein